MNDIQLGVTVRLLRHRRGWRQQDLAQAAKSSRSMVSLLESGRVLALNVATVRRIADALGMPLSWDAGWRRAEVEKLRDAGHAALANQLTRRLQRAGWQVRLEVSFNNYGERGRVDVLAYHPVARTLLVAEIKTALIDAQELLGTLDVKRRLGRQLARETGWQAEVAVPAIVFTASSASRRAVAAHSALFARFGLRGAHALAWLRRPSGRPDGLLLFMSLSDSYRVGTSQRSRRRVRLRRTRSSVESVSSAAREGPKVV